MTSPRRGWRDRYVKVGQPTGFGLLTKKTVELDKLMQGCPKRDCIPSIDDPKYVKAGDGYYEKRAGKGPDLIRRD